MPEPFDGRLLGDWFPLLRAPLPTMMLFGGMSVSRADIPHLLNATRSVRAGFHVLAMLARYARDRLRWHRGTALANGNALIGRLAFTLRKRGVPLWVDSSVTGLIERGSRVCGAHVRRAGMTMEVLAGKGVILACGARYHAIEQTIVW